MANPHIVDAWLTNQQLQRLEDYLKRGRPFASVSRTYENSPAQSYRCTGRSRIIVGTAILNCLSLLDDFDEYYKTLFRTGYDPTSILALQTWLNAIDEAWPNLALNEVLKAGRSYVKFHILFSVSAIFAAINEEPTQVVEPSATLKAAQNPGDVLPLAANCLENALQDALNKAQIGGKVFSPQNWLKNNASVQGEMLVAGTIASMLPGFPNGKALLDLMRVPAGDLANRWAAE
jgi:hypothetical protein